MQELAGKRNIRTANAMLKGGREEKCVINSLDASYVLFKKVLQLFMTEVVDQVVSTNVGQFGAGTKHRSQVTGHCFTNTETILTIYKC